MLIKGFSQLRQSRLVEEIQTHHEIHIELIISSIIKPRVIKAFHTNDSLYWESRNVQIDELLTVPLHLLKY